jgi:hypothetical protein
MRFIYGEGQVKNYALFIQFQEKPIIVNRPIEISRNHLPLNSVEMQFLKVQTCSQPLS